MIIKKNERGTSSLDLSETGMARTCFRWQSELVVDIEVNCQRKRGLWSMISQSTLEALDMIQDILLSISRAVTKVLSCFCYCITRLWYGVVWSRKIKDKYFLHQHPERDRFVNGFSKLSFELRLSESYVLDRRVQGLLDDCRSLILPERLTL